MPKGDKFQGYTKKDDTENPIWQRSLRSSQRMGKPFTGRREAAYLLDTKERKVCDTL